MVAPLLALGLAISSGLAGGWAGSYFGKDGKKEASVVQQATEQQTYQVSQIEPYGIFSPTTSYAIQYPDYQIQIDSPLARQTSKKEQTVEGYGGDVPYSLMQVPTQTPTLEAPQTEGTNMALLVGLAVVGVLGYSYLKKK